MALPDFSMRQLLEAGVHFGHQTHRWNPKMDQFIFGKRNNIHILDLSQTVPLMHHALQQVSDTVARGGRVLFVGTKRQASEQIADAARRSAQYYVNSRWLGGMLTNWKTISNSIKRLRSLDETLDQEESGFTKKELLTLTRERDKLELALGGIKDMGGTPDLLFVIDTNKEAIALQEAKKLKIPVIAILDSNSDTDHVDYPVPGNDDAARAISLYCDLVAKAAIDGIARQQGSSGIDLGAQVDPEQEETILETVSDASSDAAQAVSAGVADAAGAAGEAASGAAATTKDVGSSVFDAFSNIASTVAGAASTAGDVVSGAAEGVVEAVTGGADGSAGEEEGEDGGPLFERPAGEPDDLKKISGVGPKLEERLNALGITTFEQIANLTQDEIERVDAALSANGRIERDDWQAQAQEYSKAAA